MTAAKPSIRELEGSGDFELMGEIEHHAVHAWVRRHLFAPTWIMAAYWAANLTALAVLAAVWRSSGIPFMEGFSTACLGMMAGYLFLVPIHESCHALAYRLMGARNVHVRYDFRRLTAICIAPGEVLSSREFALVCLAPAAVLNTGLAIAAALAAPGKMALLVAGALLLHIGACSGDLAFVGYLWSHRGQRLFTFDDAEKSRTAFYRRMDTVRGARV